MDWVFKSTSFDANDNSIADNCDICVWNDSIQDYICFKSCGYVESICLSLNDGYHFAFGWIFEVFILYSTIDFCFFFFCFYINWFKFKINFSTNAFLENFFTTNTTNRFRWECLFPVDNGAFFVNYALQAAFLGNTVEILRLPELFLYIFYNILSRSSAEYENARKQVSFDFPFGVSYPRFLLIFSMTVTYSLACPLIAPCGQ